MADLSITAANVVLISGETGSGKAGEALTAGQLLYADSSDSNNLKGADADAGTETTPMKGVALGDAADDQRIVYAKDGAIVDLGLSLAAGALYVASDTAGGIKPTADLATGDVVTIVGWGDSDGYLKLHLKETGETVPA